MDWEQYPQAVGDGTFTAFNNTGEVSYYSLQRFDLHRFNHITGTDETISPNFDSSGEVFDFITPFALDPADDKILFSFSNRNIWYTFKADIANGSFGWKNLPLPTGINRILSALAFSRSKPHQVYFGDINGRITKATYDLSTSDFIFDAEYSSLPVARDVSAISVHPYNSEEILASVSSYGVQSIFLSEDEGKIWMSVGGNLEQYSRGIGNGLRCYG